ncbi:CPBP family intramembrane glutamic endopeptidase [Acidicapsa ligni]|uniref:CPBP family intramembrane glutamic endopeptidase n=1 Tax=Acidicapsa ligni TaxID=542300 RepID=UPI0021E00A3A|nr:CPBP family intramembrane glutamic endopeptidase [Acidicapsa ligni]
MSGAEDGADEKPVSETSATTAEDLHFNRPLERFEVITPPAQVHEPFEMNGPLFAMEAPHALLPIRHPNFADASLFLLMLLMGFLVASGALAFALHFHLWGLHSFAQAQNSTVIALSTQVLIYVVGVGAAIPFFTMVWGRGFFPGIHWHGATAFRLRARLVLTAAFCNVLAMLGNLVLPFPKEAPIDKLFGSQSDAWMLLVFGVTIAPFFEEMIFRGFLLPALATAWDWCHERLTGALPRGLDAEGNPIWSMPAMIFAALAVSAPFALMHSAQVAKSWGPLSLLYCISLVLCAVRLTTKSLAASTLVHSTYNFFLFAVMLVETSGFRHLNKM